MTIEEHAQVVAEPQSLAELLTKANADGLASNPKSGLSFLEKFLPGRKRLTNRLTPTLPSGLTVEEAADISNAISTTLRRLYRADQTIGDKSAPDRCHTDAGAIGLVRLVRRRNSEAGSGRSPTGTTGPGPPFLQT